MAAPKLLTCKSCGRSFIFSRSEQEYYKSRKWDSLPSLCPECRRERNHKRREEQEEQKRIEDNARREAWKKEEIVRFNQELKNWNVVDLKDISFTNDHVLYIIGNGFDMMHGVKSSYYSFRDSIGKRNSLQIDMEMLWPDVDLWADFENNLANFNAKIMADKFMISNWLDDMEAYDVEAGRTEFYMAVESAANPFIDFCTEMPRALRRWVDKLAIGTDDRPLEPIFVDGKVLCFNYTEFGETLYGVSHENVCYIHGCRKKEKYHSKDPLIIGHRPGASEGTFDDIDVFTKEPKNFRNALTELAQDEAIRLISEYDEDLTKNSEEIIKQHQNFFEDLGKIENVVVIGHSLSKVDWDYFIKVQESLNNRNEVHWYIGCHGSGDLNNLSSLADTLGLDKKQISVFRTDEIKVALLPEAEEKHIQPKQKITTVSGSKEEWNARYTGGSLKVVGADKIQYNFIFPSYIRNAFFENDDSILFVQTTDIDSTCYFFRLIDNEWEFINDLKPVQNQSLINRRLQEVVIAEDQIYFFYNSRLRVYSLADGTVVANNAYRYKQKGHGSIEGKNIREKFWPKVCY